MTAVIDRHRGIAASWAQRCLEHGEPVTARDARLVAAGAQYLLREGRGLAGAGLARQLLWLEPSIEVSPRQASLLRQVLAELERGRGDEDAIDVLLELNILIDALVDAGVERRVLLSEELALLDPLTSLANRRSLERDGPRAIAAARRRGAQLAVCIVDVDGLKRVNDTEGHPAGDEVLRRLANALSALVRASDGVYRIGGDEFVLLIDGAGLGDALTLLSRLPEDVPPHSAGVAAFPAEGETMESLLVLADRRLYEGRRNRRRSG